MSDTKLNSSVPDSTSTGLSDNSLTEIVYYCDNHPSIETSLRCNKCGKPICAKCAVSTPTGYKCKECVTGQQKVFSNTQWYDYPLAFVISVVLAGIGSFLVNLLGRFGFFFIFFVVLLAPSAGIIIAEAVRAAVQRRRSLRLWQAMAIGIVLGCLPMLIITIITFNLWMILAQGFFVVTATTSAIARLRGINIR